MDSKPLDPVHLHFLPTNQQVASQPAPPPVDSFRPFGEVTAKARLEFCGVTAGTSRVGTSQPLPP